jgi:hypothetical protein
MKAKRIAPSKIRFLWDTNLWDGPLSGTCEYEGRMCYFDIREDRDSHAHRRRSYNLYTLTTKEQRALTKQHELFRRVVGTHCDYPRGEVKPSTNWWQEYYSVYPTGSGDPALTEERLIGYFFEPR